MVQVKVRTSNGPLINFGIVASLWCQPESQEGLKLEKNFVSYFFINRWDSNVRPY